MTTQEIADRLITLCRIGAFVQAEEELYGPYVVHVETDGQEFKGFDEVLLKEKRFMEKLENTPLIKISEPMVAGNFFSVSMHMEVMHKEFGHRILDEIIVYGVNHGKIEYVRCFSSIIPKA